MQRYDDVFLVRAGASGVQPLTGVAVTVTDDTTGLLASLYSGNGVNAISNPLTTNDDGGFGFYAADGSYTLTFVHPRIATFTRKLILDDPKDNPYATLAQLAAPTGATGIGYFRTSDGVTLTVAAALDAATVQSDTSVRNAVLTGLSLVTNAAITATDTVLSAFGKLQKQFTDFFASKDASGGFPGLTGFSINFKNAANTFTSLLANANTAARTYTFPDKDITVAGIADVAALSGMQLLGTYTVGTAVASIDFLTVFSSTYDNYLIIVDGATPSATDTLALRLANAGTTDTASNYFSGGADNTAITAAAYFAAAGNLSGTSGSASVHIEVMNANSASKDKGITANGFFGGAGPDRRAIMRGGCYSGANAVSGLRLLWATGSNFSSGVVRVYALKNS